MVIFTNHHSFQQYTEVDVLHCPTRYTNAHIQHAASWRDLLRRGFQTLPARVGYLLCHTPRRAWEHPYRKVIFLSQLLLVPVWWLWRWSRRRAEGRWLPGWSGCPLSPADSKSRLVTTCFGQQNKQEFWPWVQNGAWYAWREPRQGKRMGQKQHLYVKSKMPSFHWKSEKKTFLLSGSEVQAQPNPKSWVVVNRRAAPVILNHWHWDARSDTHQPNVPRKYTVKWNTNV